LVLLPRMLVMMLVNNVKVITLICGLSTGGSGYKPAPPPWIVVVIVVVVVVVVVDTVILDSCICYNKE